MGTLYSKSRKYRSSPQTQDMQRNGPTETTPGFGFGVNHKSPTLRFRAIADHYSNVEEVQEALRKGGLESSNLIVAVDFTKSNEWTGKYSFGGRSLHAIGDAPSPYENAISAIGKTLSAFDDDGLIPCYGFGDVTTGDKSVFSFLPNDKPCQGLEQALWRYRELCPYVRMAGPTSFAPAIRQASRIVEQSGYQYHILLLVADGQVSRSSDLPDGQHSEQEQDTIDAIVEASYLPLSIVMVGVGDGPWDLMKNFDDALPQRQFDNFQFVNFTEVTSSTGTNSSRREALFALRALMEIPEQYQMIQRLGLMSRNSTARARAPRRGASHPVLDPPVPANVMNGLGSGASASTRNAPPADPKKPTDAKKPKDAGASPSKTAGSKKDEVQPDPMYLCPITQDIMTDPVLASDGYSYERSAIEQWLKNKTTSPMTNAQMPGGNVLIPNHGLRSAILQWKQENR